MSTLKDLEVGYLSSLSHLYAESEIRALFLWAAEAILSLPALELRMNRHMVLSDAQAGDFQRTLQQLESGMPVQYIFGYSYFAGRRFTVNRDVLIPRPETEELVQLVLKTNPAPIRILDIGSGSGCIPVTLKLAWPEAKVCGWDISEDALRIARKNARQLQADVNFKRADILCPPDMAAGSLDCIISNPPYVTESEKTDMAPHVLNFEPATALFVKDADPLVFYEAITKFARRALGAHGRVFLECNRKWTRQVKMLLEQAGFENACVHKDMQGNERFVSAKNSPII